VNQYSKTARLQELRVGQGNLVEVQGRQIALWKVRGQVFATSDACPHEGVSLSAGGDLQEEVVTCGFHYWCFNVCTGKSEDGIDEPLLTYPVKIVGDEIWIAIP